jgi:hypothetical protein
MRVVFAILMSAIMTLIMTLWVSILNLGFSPDFLWKWARAFVMAWPVAFLSVLMIAPKVQKISAYIVNDLLKAKHD